MAQKFKYVTYTFFFLLLFSSFGLKKIIINANFNEEIQTRIKATIDVDGLKRNYFMVFPKNYNKEINKKYPVIIVLHGFTRNGSSIEKNSSISQKANEEGFIAIYPDGYTGKSKLAIRSWNAGNCCGFSVKNKVDDVKFISNLIDKVIAENHADKNKIYVTGSSNGAMMSYRIACELSRKVAAIATVSGGMVMGDLPCNASRTVPILHIHSINDKIVPYNGGKGALGKLFPTVMDGINKWQTINKCDTLSKKIEITKGYTKTEWQNSEKKMLIINYLMNDGGHSWPSAKKPHPFIKPSKAINATNIIFNFLKENQL